MSLESLLQSFSKPSKTIVEPSETIVEPSEIFSEEPIRPVPSEEIPSFPECDYDTNPTDLYRAIKAKKWDAITHFLLSGNWSGAWTPQSDQTPSTQACTWVTKYETSIDGSEESGKWSRLPIHAALIYKAPEAVIMLLLKICPGSVKCADAQRMLPLHLAFRHGASDATVGLLLDLCPEAVGARNFKDGTPVDCALTGSHPQRSKIIQTILQKNKKKWQKKETRMEAKLRKQGRQIKKSRKTLETKEEEVSNLNVAVDLIKWRQDQTEKVLLTVVSELKDINGWYQQHEKKATKEAIVEDLATKVASLQQIAEELVAEAERQTDGKNVSPSDTRQALFGNISNLGAIPNRADTVNDNESVSAYSSGTAASFWEDNIHMNSHIVFLGSQDASSGLSNGNGLKFTRSRSVSSKASVHTKACCDEPSANQEQPREAETPKMKAKGESVLLDPISLSAVGLTRANSNFTTTDAQSTETTPPDEPDTSKPESVPSSSDMPPPTPSVCSTIDALVCLGVVSLGVAPSLSNISTPEAEARQSDIASTELEQTEKQTQYSIDAPAPIDSRAPLPPLHPSATDTSKQRKPFLKSLRRVSGRLSVKQKSQKASKNTGKVNAMPSEKSSVAAMDGSDVISKISKLDGLSEDIRSNERPEDHPSIKSVVSSKAPVDKAQSLPEDVTEAASAASAAVASIKSVKSEKSARPEQAITALMTTASDVLNKAPSKAEITNHASSSGDDAEEVSRTAASIASVAKPTKENPLVATSSDISSRVSSVGLNTESDHLATDKMDALSLTLESQIIQKEGDVPSLWRDTGIPYVETAREDTNEGNYAAISTHGDESINTAVKSDDVAMAGSAKNANIIRHASDLSTHGAVKEMIEVVEMFTLDAAAEEAEQEHEETSSDSPAWTTTIEMNDNGEFEVVLPEVEDALVVDDVSSGTEEDASTNETIGSNRVSDLRFSFRGALNKASKMASKLAPKPKTRRSSSSKNAPSSAAGGMVKAAKPDLAARKQIFKSSFVNGQSSKKVSPL